MARSVHVCVSIRGVLHWDNRYTSRMIGGKEPCFTKDNGKHYKSVAEFRGELMDLLANGHEKLPPGDCDNFDPKHGCLGHEVPESGDADGKRSE